MKKSLTAERGASLIFALVALGIGALLIGPIFSYLVSRYEVTKAVERRLKAQYTTDAGAEYAIWRVQYDGAWRQLLTTQPGTVAIMAVPSPVNDETAEVEIVYVGSTSEDDGGVGEGGSSGGETTMVQCPWAIWATDTSDTAVNIVGNQATIYGEVHSNGRVYFSSNQANIYGDVHSARDVNLNWNQARVYGNIYTNGNVTLANNQFLVQGDIYAAGDVTLNWNQAKVTGNVFTDGSVILSGSSAVIEGTVFADNGVTISWSQANIRGAVYTDGPTTLSGWQSKIDGNLYSDASVILSGGQSRITGNVYGDGDIRITGWQAKIDGSIIRDGKISDIYTYSAPPLQLEAPIHFAIDDFDLSKNGTYALQAQAKGMYYFHSGDWSVTMNQAIIPDGLHFCTGNVSISANQLTANRVTIVALGTISISSNQPQFSHSYVPGLAFFSNSASGQAITISSNQFTCAGGLVYAPNGGIDLLGNQPRHRGAFLAKNVRISSNEADIGVPEGLMIPQKEGQSVEYTARAFPWALLATGNSDSAILIDGTNSDITGDVHSNGGIRITKNNTKIQGTVEYVTTFLDEANGTHITPLPRQVVSSTFLFPWTLEMFQPGGSAALAAGSDYHYIGGDWAPSQETDMLSGLYYVNGNVKINSNNLVGTDVTIVASGKILFNKNKNDYFGSYVDGLLFYSAVGMNEDYAIKIDGNNFECSDGIVYAPNGVIELAGNNAVVDGAFVANEIKITKNNLTLTLPEGFTTVWSPPEGSDGGSVQCHIFDLRSRLGELTTTVRFRQCGSGDLFIDAWHMQ